MTRPLRNPREVTPIWKGPSLKQVRAAKKRRKAEALTAARAECFRAAQWRCSRCGSDRHLHAHHVRRRSQGGADDPSNLACLCAACHDHVHRNPDEARRDGWLL